MMKGNKWAHIIFWLSYWLIFSFINSRYDGDFQKFLLVEAMTLPFKAGAVYLSLFVMQQTKRPGLVLLFLFLIIAGSGLVYRLFKYYWLVPKYFPESTIDLWGFRALYDILDILMAVGVFISIWMYQLNQKQLRETESLKSEKLIAELAALKNQIHPHFLFNTINNIYGLARQSSANTAPAMLKLSQLLRFVLYESQKPTITLETELNIIDDYLELEKLRFDEDRLTLQMHKAVENPSFGIAPLLLFPLVENAFKHGASESIFDGKIEIHVFQSGNRLDFKVKNSISENIVRDTQKGIGLSNLKRQLELIYGEKADLLIERSDTFFCATIKLTL